MFLRFVFVLVAKTCARAHCRVHLAKVQGLLGYVTSLSFGLSVMG